MLRALVEETRYEKCGIWELDYAYQCAKRLNLYKPAIGAVKVPS